MNDTGTNTTIRVIELFAGIGGFRLGLERTNQIRGQSWKGQKGDGESSSSIESAQTAQQNIRCNGDMPDYKQPRNSRSLQYSVIWANEWDKHAAQIYRKNFGEKELVEGDIHKVNTNDIPECDMLVGGFPCQPFSMAGKRQGFKDIRGTLFFEIVRIAEAKQPKLLFLENVKGLLNHDNGDTFETIIRTLDELGYDVEWKVLNSKYFGVPQNRERVFIIGHSRNYSTRQIFPIIESGRDYGELGEEQQGEQCGVRTDDICPALRGGDKWSTFISPTISAGISKHHSTDTLIYQHPRNINRQCLYEQDEVIQNLRTVQRPPSPKIIAQALQTDGFLRQGSSFGTNNPQSSRNIRRLTPKECERLQGFPDNWTEGVCDTHRFKCLGNAVSVPVIRAIGELMLEVL